MRYLVILLMLISVFLSGQEPWVTGSNTGDGELKSRFRYLKSIADSSKNIFNYEDSAVNSLLYIDYKLTDGWSMEEGRSGWNDEDKTLEIGLDQGSALQIGQEIHVRSTNKTGVDIDDGDVVYVSGAQGNRPTIALASDTSITAILTLGVATQDIANNAIGYVTIIGLVRGYDTRNFTAGDVLWLGTTPGSLVNTRPPAPRTAVTLGVALNSTEDGIIAVRPVVVQRLSWLSDVDARDNQTNWDILYWNTDSLEWELSDGLIEADSVVTRVLDYEPPHGALAFSDSTATLDLTQNTWAKVTNLANDLYTVIDNDGVTMQGDSMTIVTPGDYMLWVGLSFNGNSQDVYHCAIYKNGLVTPFEMHRKTANNDTGNMSMPALLDDLVAGDDLALYIQNTANNNDPTFISSQIVITLIHPD